VDELRVALPTSLIEFAESQVAERGLNDVSQYVGNLIDADRALREELAGLVEEHRDRLKTLALEGLDSGDAGPMTKADWDRLRDPFRKRPPTATQET
jgi:predicted aminopeptidase